jgi:hypothetical protein
LLSLFVLNINNLIFSEYKDFSKKRKMNPQPPQFISSQIAYNPFSPVTRKRGSGIVWLRTSLTILAMLLVCSLTAQTLIVSRSSPTTGWSKTLSSAATINFPAAGAGPVVLTFKILNSSTSPSPLVLSGSPPVATSGPDASRFSVVQPASTSLGPGASTTFTVTYNPGDSLQHTAQLSIPNNVTLPFIINLKGAGNLFFGAQFPPPGTYGYTFSQTGNIGRTGGNNFILSSVGLSTKTASYWGPSITSTGDLQMQCSLDGSSYTGTENFTYAPAESNLAGGIAVWRGNSILNTLYGNVSVYLKCVLTATKPGPLVFPLTDPTSLGLSEEIGGLVKFSSLSDNLNANIIILASTNNISFTPYLDFYDNYLNKTCGSCAYVSVTTGFYWKDLRPVLSVNAGLLLNEGATAAIDAPSKLNATDDEDLPAHPERIVFNFTTTPGPNPLSFATGVIKLNGIPLTTANTFTLQDMQNNLLTFTHDGSETIHDEFQFSLRDGNGVLARDGAYTSFNFPITIVPVNDPPVTRDSSFTFSYALPITRSLVASDPDNVSLTFSIVTYPTKGTISGFNSSTGQFTYTPTFGAPTTDFFTFKVFDGTAFSNVSTITLNQVNLPPVANNISRSALEDVVITGLLAALDPEGGFPLTFQKIKSPSKGTATVLSAGMYTYTPNPSSFGGDYFTFKALDPQGNLSLEDTVFISIIPRLDPGDILVVDQNALRLFDPVTHRDTIISKNQGLTQGLNLAYKPGTSVFAFDKVTGIIKINPVSGNQTLVAARGGFSGGGLIGGAPGMLIDNAGKIIVADGSNGILKVDTTSGAITSLFSGGSLQFPTGVAYLNNGDLMVSDAGFMAGGSSKILRITPAGIQTVVCTDVTIKVPLDLAVMDQNTVVVCDAGSFAGGADNVYKINLAAGSLTVLSSGGNLAIPTGLDFSQNKLYVVNNNGTRKLLDIDILNGTQTILPGSVFTQPWGLAIVPSGVPVAKTLQNVVIPNGQSSCYNATQTITVAGGGTTFIVQNGGSATMIAGLKILYEPGTLASSGSYMHGYIAPGGPYCYTPSLPAVVASEEEIPSISAQSFFKIYPNPTSGNFILEQKGDREFRNCKVEVYGMRGEKVAETLMNGERKHEFMFADMPVGLYFIRVIADNEAETFKLIKTR